MLHHLLPFLAISGVVASPLRPQRRQDTSAISSVSSAIGQSTATATAAGSIVSSASIAVSQTSSAPAAGSTASSGNGTAAAPSVTMYPDTSNGEPIVVNGAPALLPGVDSYLGVPFAAPRTSPILSLYLLTRSCRRFTIISSAVADLQLQHRRYHSTGLVPAITSFSIRR